LGLNRESHAISHDAKDLGSVAKMGKWYAQQFAYLLASLRDRPEGNGNMLDNSLVVWGVTCGTTTCWFRSATQWVPRE